MLRHEMKPEAPVLQLCTTGFYEGASKSVFMQDFTDYINEYDDDIKTYLSW